MNDKYYMFSGSTDLSTCHAANFRTDGAMVFSKDGLMISPCLDSGESGTVWDKAEISFSAAQDGYFCFTAFSSDRLTVNVGGQAAPINMVLETIAEGRQLSEISSEITAVRFISPDSAPLHRLRGRYAWFIIEAFPGNNGTFSIDSIKISYPLVSYMDALPEIVRRTDNGELASMLAMYKTVFDRLDRRIVGFDDELDIDLASGEALNRLASWQGVPISGIWGEDILRSVIRNSAWLIRRKGTKAALSRLFELLLGEPPEIEENTAGDPFCFTVRVKYSLIPDGAHHRELLYLLNEFSPAGCSPRLLLEKSGGGAALDSGSTLCDEEFDSGIILD